LSNTISLQSVCIPVLLYAALCLAIEELTYYKALFATMAANGQTDTQNDKMTKQRRGKNIDSDFK